MQAGQRVSSRPNVHLARSFQGATARPETRPQLRLTRGCRRSGGAERVSAKLGLVDTAGGCKDKN
jgi:hypothetical protein